MTWRQSSHQVGGLWGERGWLKEVSRKSFPTSFLSSLFRQAIAIRKLHLEVSTPSYSLSLNPSSPAGGGGRLRRCGSLCYVFHLESRQASSVFHLGQAPFDPTVNLVVLHSTSWSYLDDKDLLPGEPLRSPNSPNTGQTGRGPQLLNKKPPSSPFSFFLSFPLKSPFSDRDFEKYERIVRVWGPGRTRTPISCCCCYYYYWSWFQKRSRFLHILMASTVSMILPLLQVPSISTAPRGTPLAPCLFLSLCLFS